MPETDFRRLKLLVLDVDGVLTDGSITLTPDGTELKTFNTKDGAGVKYWIRAGGRVAMISGRGSDAVRLRAKELGIQAVKLNAKNKLSAYREVLGELDAQPEEAIVMGDDLPDLPVMCSCGFAACPADAVGEVRRVADYIAALRGGRGCVREVVELVLKRSGRWDGIMSRYLPAEGHVQ